MTETRSSRLSDPRRVMRRSFEVFIVALVAMVTTFLLVFAASLYEAGQANAIDKAAALEQYVRRSLAVSAVVATEALDHLEKRGSVEGIASDYDARLEFARLVVPSRMIT